LAADVESHFCARLNKKSRSRAFCVIDAARKRGIPVIVDPKSPNLAIYRGATLLKPNRKEFSEATRSAAEISSARHSETPT